MVTGFPADLLPGRVFAYARGWLAKAGAARDDMNAAWNAGTGQDEAAFDAWVEMLEDGTRELWCSFELAQEHAEQVEHAAAAFVRAIKASLDACVVAAANATSRWGLADPDTHRMPLCTHADEFDALPRQDRLKYLRPDQVRALRELQPFAGGTRSKDFVGRQMTHLAEALGALHAAKPLFGAWVDNINPIFDLPEDARIARLNIDPPGVARPRRRVASFAIKPDYRYSDVSADPNVSVDAVLDVGPEPVNPDDNASFRTRSLMLLTTRLIEGLERSVNTDSLLDRFGSLDELLPPSVSEEWKPVWFDDPADAARTREQVAASDIGRATYRGAEGHLVFLKIDGDGQIVGREIPDAAPPPIGSDSQGIAVERATRAAGARWGLPDFVLEPAVVRKGSGIREYPDGTILTGNRGVALQVKARDSTTDTPERARNWLTKKSTDGLRQARGTIRTTLGGTEVTLNNLRGRAITFNGKAVDWLPVVILDHPDPPEEVTIEPDGKGPHVVLMRRDWEFLWYQLRSATAIVNYLHRVAPEGSVELGTEAWRYFELAYKDANAEPNTVPDWLAGTDADPTNDPLLPADPAPSSDEAGHAAFHRILEDVADSPFDGAESDRLTMLALIDQFPVTARPELGRTLLRRLDHCAKAPPSEFRAQHRLVFLEGGNLQLIFTVMTQFSVADQEFHRRFVLHRRQTYLRMSGAIGPILPWTVGIVLTPRPDTGRPWDTTVIATNGPAYFDDEEYDMLTPLLAPSGGRDTAVT